MSQLFQAPSAVQSVRTLVDGGIKLDVVTQELNPEELALLFSLRGKVGWFLFSENELSPSDLPEESAGDMASPKRTQRMTAKLHAIWTKGSQAVAWEDFCKRYWDAMEQKLDEQLE